MRRIILAVIFLLNKEAVTGYSFQLFSFVYKVWSMRNRTDSFKPRKGAVIKNILFVSRIA